LPKREKDLNGLGQGIDEAVIPTATVTPLRANRCLFILGEEVLPLIPRLRAPGLILLEEGGAEGSVPIEIIRSSR